MAWGPMTRVGMNEWMAQGKCATDVSINPEWFFPSQPDLLGWGATAVRICTDCPVRYQCLDYAMKAHPIEGIWGGTTFQDRSTLHSFQIKEDESA